MSLERTLNVTVLFTDGKRINVNIKALNTVKDLLASIQQDPSIIIPQNANPVILYHGKIVSQDEQLANLESMDDFTVHCFFKIIKLDENQDKTSTTDIDLRGFDRLQRLNYSREQIDRIRTNFRNIQQNEGEVSEEEQIEIEDEWFPALFTTELPLDSIFEETDDVDPPVVPSNIPRPIWNKSLLFFALGFFFGYFLGIGSFIFAFLTIRNKKTLIGVLFGSCIHYACTVMNN